MAGKINKKKKKTLTTQEPEQIKENKNITPRHKFTLLSPTELTTPPGMWIQRQRGSGIEETAEELLVKPMQRGEGRRKDKLERNQGNGMKRRKR